MKYQYPFIEKEGAIQKQKPSGLFGLGYEYRWFKLHGEVLAYFE